MTRHEFLAQLHDLLRPKVYLEIGVHTGQSLRLAQFSEHAFGVDPNPMVGQPPANSIIMPMTSDEFFEKRWFILPPVNLAFIDGMHLFEYALRDFMHIERAADAGTVVVVDDILPAHPAQAARERRTRVWTGDIWKLQACLAEHRPDLFVLQLDTAPTGLLLVAGLDPANRVLWDRYNPIVRKYAAEADPPPEVLARRDALPPAGPGLDRVLAVLAAQRTTPLPPRALVARLREALREPGAA